MPVWAIQNLGQPFAAVKRASGEEPLLRTRRTAGRERLGWPRLLGVAAQSERLRPAARVAAASALLDRGWGKPAQAIQATTTNASAVVMLGKGDPVEIAAHYRRWLMDGTLVGDNDS